MITNVLPPFFMVHSVHINHATIYQTQKRQFFKHTQTTEYNVHAHPEHLTGWVK